MATKSGRTIGYTKQKTAKELLFCWEALLIVILLAVNIMNICLSSNYLNLYNLFTNINSFLVKGFIAFPMAYILLLGDIDLSVGSVVCLSATILGITYNGTGSIVLAIIACLLVGFACGAFNGLVLTKFTELAPMIVTLATMTLFRGLSERILGDTSTKGMRNVKWFANIYDGRIGPVPYLFILFVILAIVFGLVMHKTTFGRHMFAIGANKVAAEYAGIRVQRIRFIVFTLMGFICGMSGVFYSSWVGSIKNDIADGYELEAISMCVLGGISSMGGKGTFPGALIAIFIIGLLRYGLGLINVNSQTISIIIGTLLIFVVMAPNLKFKLPGKKEVDSTASEN
ncbi:MAG: ABC transporter permease [Lachnospiraceae bacterium]|nr:ABC transporter permease [Lachnospiraceae bacterium]